VTPEPPLYLDHAATTPLAPEAAAAMAPWLQPGAVGNASSAHAAGRAARAAVEDARDRVAAALGVAPLDVVFTSGGTEADNAAIKGLAWAARAAGRPAGVVTTAIEHHAVLEAATWLRDREGLPVHVCEVGEDGVVDPDRLLDRVDAAAAAREGPALVSAMAANNELGTVQPLEVLGPALVERGVALHVDAVQALGRIPLDLAAWRAAAVALTGHKVGGPVGCGALVLRRDTACEPLLHGGGQERGVRSGTLPVAAIAGFAAAVEAAVGRQAEEAVRLAALRDRLEAALTAVDGVTTTCPTAPRLPSHLHVAVAGADPEALLLALDRAGVACSTGSACQSGAAERSHVLDAVGADDAAAHLRLSLGWTTTDADVDAAAAAVVAALADLRARAGA
jgi:cysteine desulfurase